MINNNEYAWEDIAVVVDGNPLPLEGITGIEYTIKKAHGNVYGRGAKPVSAYKGKKEFEGKLTVLQSQLEAWTRTMDGGEDLTEKNPFSVTVAYAPLDGVSTVDQCLYCRITEVTKAYKNEDNFMVVDLPLAIGDILHNV